MKYIRQQKALENQIEEPGVPYYTYQDYMNFDFEYMVEIIKGQIFKVTPAPGTLHQKITTRLTLTIAPHFEKGNWQYFSAPTDVILQSRNKKQKDTVVQPDHFLVCDPLKIQERGCFGAPDWIIEILSPHNKKKDLNVKYEVYEEAGVKEYWIVMPREKIVETFQLVNKKYQRMGVYAEDDTILPSSFLS